MDSENLSDRKHVRQQSNSKGGKLTPEEADQRAIPKKEARGELTGTRWTWSARGVRVSRIPGTSLASTAGNAPLATKNQLAITSCSLGTCAALGVAGVLIVCVFQPDLFYYGGRIRPWVNGVIATSVLSVILGHLASRQIKRSGGKQNGQGLVFIGLILGYPIAVVLFLVPFLLMFLLTGFDGIVYLWNEFFG